jgi:nucleoside-diphosphate-sugar epimerase
MQTFVTGGSGFLGRNLLAALRARGDEVRALARSDEAIGAVSRLGADPVRGEVGDAEAMREGMRGCDVVYHAAALATRWGPADQFYRSNVGGTRNVIAAARAAGVRRLVHVSTEAVLIAGPPVHGADETRPRPSQPVGPYAWSKGLAEDEVVAANGPGLETVVVRPRLIWGKGDSTVLPQMIEAVRDGRFMWVDGGHYLTSTCHVRNVCEGLILAAERGRPGEIYFLTDGAPVEFRGFITSVLRTQGVEPGERSVPRWAARLAAAAEGPWRLFRLAGAPPVDRASLASLGEEITVSDAKARRELGYRGAVTLDAGLAEMRR